VPRLRASPAAPLRALAAVLVAATALTALGAAPAAKKPAKRSAAEVAAANAATLAHLFDGLPAPATPWDTIVFHHSATAGGSKKRFDAGHAKKFGDPDGMEYHFLIGSGVGTEDGLIEVGDRWPRQIIAWHLFTRARDAGSIAICLVGNFELAGVVPTPAQRAAATALARALAARYTVPPDRVIMHRSIDGRLTQCPGKNFPLAALRAAIFAPLP